MALPSVAAFVGGESVEYCLVRSSLQFDIERSVDLEAALVHLVRAVFVLKVAANLLDKIRRQGIRIVRQTEKQRGRAGVGGLRRP